MCFTLLLEELEKKMEETLINKLDFQRQVIFLLKIIPIFTIVPFIGTILHELGHYLVAILNGYEAQIHFNYTTSTIIPANEPIIYFYYILGGPLSTWVQCILPFLLLIFFFNKKRDKKIIKEDFFDKYFILCLFFISMGGRFIFNAIIYIFTRSKTIDEYKMADFLMIYPETFLILFAGISLIIFIISILKIPKDLRINTVIGALIGSGLGYYLWNYIFGPLILP